MNIKKNILCSVLLMAACLIAGIGVRGRFTDIFADNGTAGGLEQVSVAQLSMEYEELLNMQEGEADNCKTILKVKATGQIHFVAGNSLQKVIVEKIIRNTVKQDVTEGQELSVVGQGTVFWSDMSMNMGFQNFFEKDKEYLVFLGNKLEVGFDEDGEVFPFYDRLTVFRSVCLENGSNTYVPGEVYVPYKEVKQNEFFVADKETEQMVLQIKKNLLKKYLGDVY